VGYRSVWAAGSTDAVAGSGTANHDGEAQVVLPEPIFCGGGAALVPELP